MEGNANWLLTATAWYYKKHVSNHQNIQEEIQRNEGALRPIQSIHNKVSVLNYFQIYYPHQPGLLSAHQRTTRQVKLNLGRHSKQVILGNQNIFEDKIAQRTSPTAPQWGDLDQRTVQM